MIYWLPACETFYAHERLVFICSKVKICVQLWRTASRHGLAEGGLGFRNGDRHKHSFLPLLARACRSIRKLLGDP
jgi:hypothetical protein